MNVLTYPITMTAPTYVWLIHLILAIFGMGFGMWYIIIIIRERATRRKED